MSSGMNMSLLMVVGLALLGVIALAIVLFITRKK